MRRRKFIAGLGATTAWPVVARAQQPGKIMRIGVITVGSNFRREILTESLQALGWVEGKNVVFEFRVAGNILDRLPELVAELIHLKVDVIIAQGTLAPLAVKRATTTIPIVMAAAGDPLGSGLVSSLARPGANVTGLSLISPDLGGKRLEILRDVLPGVSRVAILWNAANPYPALVFNETERAARTLGIQVSSLEVRSPADIDAALDAAIRQNPSALITVEDPLTNDYKSKIIDFVAANRLPSIYGHREFTDSGGLMSYGANLVDLYQRSAGYVDRILRGAKPADLPIEQPTKFELVINLKTAKALGLTVPPTLIARADEVIE